MSSENFIKNLTSKDKNLYKQTLQELINSSDSKQFSELCQNCDFIFPFVKERIISDFVKLVNKENLKTVFEFSKIYCADFEDLIVKSWVKFANEALSDEILELLDKGEVEQKAYAVLYFKYIKDNLCLEALDKLSKSDFQPLKINCAKVLAEFKDTKTLNEMMEIAKNSKDDFEILSAFEFISAYNDIKAIEFILKNGFNTSFSSNIISNLLDYNDITVIRKNSDDETFIKIFTTIIEAYPEDIELNTLLYYQIFDFVELISKINSQYAKNSLIVAREKFREFFSNEIYSFDLDKNLKNELKNITDFLNELDLSTKDIDLELDNYNNSKRFITALEVVGIVKDKNYSKKIANLINNNKLSYDLMAQGALTLKELNEISLIDKEIVEKIENENVKALIKSYY